MKQLWQKKKTRKKTNHRVKPMLAKDKSNAKRWDVKPSLLILTAASFLVLIASYVLWNKLMDPLTLPLRQVALEATFDNVSKQDLHQVVSAQINGGFFSLDVETVTAAVAALPWVDSVNVHRVWPDTLHVTINEQVALARWHDQALVNVRGELFYPKANSFTENLVELNGPDTSVAQLAQQLGVFSQALEESQYKMKRINLSQRRAWELELDNGVVVVLGRHAIEKRLNNFVRFYPKLLNKMESVRRIDMRYTNGFAVQWNV